MKNNIINLISGNLSVLCTGCSACVYACPNEALKMVQMDEGFLYPVIDQEKCINCGVCIDSCQIIDPFKINCPKAIYSAISATEQEISSSGGIVSELSKRIIKRGGIVYGAAFIDERKEVRHVSSNEVNLQKLLRSKYVQSDLNNTFFKIKKKLLSNKNLVLFCGTPCQVNGLKKYLGKEFENLYTIDFFCHGVPSPKVFSDYIRYYEEKFNSTIIDFTFREKDYGWRKQCIKIYFSNGKIFREKSKFSVFYSLFINNYILRSSCYNCKLYDRHSSDITLGDDWSIFDKYGVSLIVENNEKGTKLMNEIHACIVVRKQYNSDIFNYEFYKHDYKMTKRKHFFNYYLRKKKNWEFVSHYHFLPYIKFFQKTIKRFLPF